VTYIRVNCVRFNIFLKYKPYKFAGNVYCD
jgi:hypothetical protein